MYGKYKFTLPATPCTEEMRDKIVAYSRMKGQSISETKREAFALFLSKIGHNVTNETSVNDQEMTKEVKA